MGNFLVTDLPLVPKENLPKYCHHVMDLLPASLLEVRGGEIPGFPKPQLALWTPAHRKHVSFDADKLSEEGWYCALRNMGLGSYISGSKTTH